jgi:carbon monoxide dehydrogenase subunit G/molybdopterin biosynthesis enzyme
MRFEGVVAIAAPRQRVWEFLTDPEKVAQCAPGVDSLEVLAPGERFRATASVGFGSIRARFVTEAEWLDMVALERARMKVHGTAPGSAVDAESEMLLSDGPDGHTELRWSADVNVLGTIASMAARLMGGVAQRLTAAFFEAVRRRIEAHRPYRFGPCPLEAAEGRILGHNVAGGDGRLLLGKGHRLSAEDVALLHSLGRRVVYAAEPGTDDVAEDAAALRIAQAARGPGLRVAGPAAGRANLVATELGVFRVDAGRLRRVNEIEGLALATLPAHALVREGQVAATIKVIPFAVPEGSVRAAEAVAAEGGALLGVDPMPAREAALVLTGSRSAAERVRAAFEPPLRARLAAWGSSVRDVLHVALEDETGEAELAEALRRQVDGGAGLVVVAGETAIVDRHDIVPRAIELAGGEVAAYGVPMDPGHLLLLAYFGPVPVVGAPGCARSPEPNVLDAVLPRLLAGERLGRADLIALGHGGLREDVAERPMPRDGASSSPAAIDSPPAE